MGALRCLCAPFLPVKCPRFQPWGGGRAGSAGPALEPVGLLRAFPDVNDPGTISRRGERGGACPASRAGGACAGADVGAVPLQPPSPRLGPAGPVPAGLFKRRAASWLHL